jgi:hypothetical protein
MVVLDFFGIFYCCSRFRFELAFWLEGKAIHVCTLCVVRTSECPSYGVRY